MKKYMFMICAAAIVAACTQEEPLESNSSNSMSYISVRTDVCDTKTYFDAGDEDGVYKVLWEEDDVVSANGMSSQTVEIVEDGVLANFGFGQEIVGDVDIVYPASNVASYADGVATLTLPEEQKYVEGSFDAASGVIYGSGNVVDGVTLSHAMAYMKITPIIGEDSAHAAHEFQRLTITTAGEKVSGTFKLNFAEGGLVAEEEASQTVSSDCEEGIGYGNAIIVAIPAQTYAEGMKMILKDTYGCIYEATSSRKLIAEPGVMYSSTISFEEAERKLLAEACEQRSSTLSFKWKYNDGTSPANVAYTVNLYDSSDNLVRSHTYPTTGDIVRKFVFAGLDQNTAYKFEVVDPDGIRSEKVSATTKPFTVVTIPEHPLAPSATNVTILAEDMSLLSFDGDVNNNAAGFAPATRKIGPDFTNGTVVKPDGGVGLFSNPTLRGSLTGTRLEGWAYENYAVEVAGAGYFKLGAYASGDWASIFSPVLTCIPEGYTAKVKVTMNVAHYDYPNENSAARVTVVDGGVTATYNHTAYAEGDSEPITLTTEFAEHEVVLEGVSNKSRIKLGPDFEASESLDQRRILVAGMKVEVLSIDWAGAADVEVRDVYYSEATVAWKNVESAKYNVYIDDVKWNAEPLSGLSYHVTELKNNTKYSLKVGFVVNDVETYSSPVEFTTKNVWLYEAGPTHVCVQWDDISAYTRNNGFDRAYEMVLYKDEACTQVHAQLYPFNGVLSNSYAFAGSAWLGKTANVANMYDTRVSFGMLQPETTYWFRVRSLASVSVNKNNGDPVVLTNAAGDSQWSDPLPVTTEAAHVAGSKEVIYQGFDHFSIGRDMHNQCVGASPKITTASDRLEFASLDSFDGEWVCQEMAGSYRIDEWGFASLLEGAETDYLTGKTFNGMWNYVGKDGWHYGQYHNGTKIANSVFAEMGYLHIDAKKETYVGTPQLYNNLSAGGTKCTLTFKGFANFSGYNKNTAKPLKLKIYRAATKTVEDVDCPGIQYKYTNASPSSTDFSFDVSWKPVSKDITLYPGDAVIIVNNGASRFMIDDIMIVAK